LILQALDELEGDLRNNGLRSIYVILGPEVYQSRQALELLKSKILSPDSIPFDYSEFSGTEAAASRITEAAGTFPMMGKRRLVLVAESDRLKDEEQEKLIDSLKDISPRSTLILVAEDLDRRKRFYKALHESGCVVEFRRLKGLALERWAESFVRRACYRLSADGLKQVIELAGADLQSLAMELEKLFLYAGKEKSIPDSAIADMVSGSRQHGIFDLVDAVGSRDRNGALRLLANLVETGEDPLGIVAMLARHCRQVLIAKECILQGSNALDTARATQTSPYFVDKLLRQSRSADASVIRQMYIRLAEIDRRLKTSGGDGRILLEKLLCALV
jgi:DNA polymerase-3 subunit delta